MDLNCAVLKSGKWRWVVAAIAMGAAGAWAQGYPTKPVELVVHTSAGGGGDLFARTVAEIITREKLLAQPLVVNNKAGGGGTIAFSYVAGKRGDSLPPRSAAASTSGWTSSPRSPRWVWI
jgi:tripartite-type tricarboxylate transporter receptor subunit TctC